MLYLILSAVTVLFVIYAQWKAKNTYVRYSQVQSKKGISGKKLTRDFLSYFKIKDVDIKEIKGTLTDHYDSKNKVIRLSKGVGEGLSLAALGIAGHEAGHAVQHSKGYLPFQVRNSIAPIITAIIFLSPFLFIFSVFAPPLLDIVLLLLIIVIIFYIVTLPIEFDASRRALALLKGKNYLDKDELSKTRKVLMAAALTYVAANLVLIVRFFQLLLGRKR